MRLQQKSDTAEQTPLYNTDSVRQILARASELEQQTQQDLLSPEQIEELGREIGLSPETVRRALKEQQYGNRQAHSAVSAHVVTPPAPKNFWSICMPGAMHAVVVGLIYFRTFMSGYSYGNFTNLILLLVVGTPFILAFFAGWRQYNRSLAIAAGVTTMFLPWFAFFIALLLSPHVYFHFGAQEIVMIVITLIIASLLAWGGNIARHQYEARQAKRDLAKQR